MTDVHQGYRVEEGESCGCRWYPATRTLKLCLAHLQDQAQDIRGEQILDEIEKAAQDAPSDEGEERMPW